MLHYAAMKPTYERMKAAYSRTAAFMQGRMQPACIPSVNPAFLVIMVVFCFICSARGHRQTVV